MPAAVNAPIALTFVDEVGMPLPAGVTVTVYTYTNQQQGGMVSQAVTVKGGIAYVSLLSETNVSYVATFAGNLAPTVPVIFGPDEIPIYYDSGYSYDSSIDYDSTAEGEGQITVIGYRSPFLAPVGAASDGTDPLQYAAAGALLQPTGWYDQTALLPGGNLYNLMAGLLAGIGAEDANAQAVLETLRVETCVGSEIDSWAYDFLGPLFQRFSNESDADYYGRVLTMISRPRTTINSIQALCIAFFKYIEDQPALPSAGQLAFDAAGGYNSTGAFNTNPPPMQPPLPGTAIVVWDAVTQPTLASIFGVGANQFVIQIGALVVSQSQLLAFNLTGGDNVSGAFNVAPTAQLLPTPTPSPPDARLGTILQIIGKAAGVEILYIYGPSLQE